MPGKANRVKEANEANEANDRLKMLAQDKKVWENASVVRMTPAQMEKRAKKENAILYENTFTNNFEPWERERISANMAKLAAGRVEGGDDEELNLFVELHPTLSKMAKQKGAGGGSEASKASNAAQAALKQLFLAHDDILSGKRSEDDAMKKLMHGVFANFKREREEEDSKCRQRS